MRWLFARWNKKKKKQKRTTKCVLAYSGSYRGFAVGEFVWFIYIRFWSWTAHVLASCVLHFRNELRADSNRSLGKAATFSTHTTQRHSEATSPWFTSLTYCLLDEQRLEQKRSWRKSMSFGALLPLDWGRLHSDRRGTGIIRCVVICKDLRDLREIDDEHLSMWLLQSSSLFFFFKRVDLLCCFDDPKTAPLISYIICER